MDKILILPFLIFFSVSTFTHRVVDISYITVASIDVEQGSQKQNSLIPEELQGNWLRADGSNDWVLGLQNSFAIYEGDFWEYQTVEKNGRFLKIGLTKGKESIIFDIKQKKNGRIEFICFGKKQVLSKNRIAVKNYVRPNYSEFEDIKFSNDSAYVKGYLTNYDTASANFKYGEIFLHNIFKRKQEVFLIKIEPDGRFFGSFPLLHPYGNVLIRIGQNMSTSFFAVPNGHHFLFVDQKKKGEPEVYYMGDEACVSTEIQDFKHIFQGVINYKEKNSKINQLKPNDYKAYELEKLEKYNQILNDFIAKNRPSKKFKQYYRNSIKYLTMQDLLKNRWSHNLQNSEKVVLSDEYLSFTKELPLNDEVSLLNDNYIQVLDHLKSVYSDRTRKIKIPINGEEKFVLSISPEQRFERLAKYGNGVSSEDKKLINRFIIKENLQADDILKLQNFQEKYSKELEVVSSSYFTRKKMEGVVSSTEIGLARNIILSNQMLEQVVDKKTLLNEESLSYYLEHCQDTFMQELVLKEYKKVQELYGNLELPNNSHLLSQLDSENDENILFQKLIENYKGKVIYVDFWGTWCSPCIAQFPFAKKLKKKFEGKDVVFLYFAVQSPENQWKAMIKDKGIQGVHYRLNSDENALLSSLFDISYYPTYILIDKQGKVVDSKAKSPKEGEALFADIERLLIK